MSDVVQRLLQVEEEAKSIIEQARQEASSLVEDARLEARRTVDQSRLAARAEADEIVRAREQEARDERQRALDEAGRSAVSIESTDPDRLKHAVDRVVQVIARRETDAPP
ncbi:MAG: hypothetical protein QGI33_00190 [Candidatus Brocadiia bacterium]|nr:hypothetical protein [Candidatus Brocadiia bacterium]